MVLGAGGMLGHRLAAVLAPRFEVVATLRGAAGAVSSAVCGTTVVGGVDVADEGGLARLLDRFRPEAVLNAVGVVKQRLGPGDGEEAVTINALLPHRLARLCGTRGIRLVQFGTDCVFSGRAADVRGPDGYREDDPAEPADIYGRSKLLGEPEAPHVLVLRTSIIGREAGRRQGLVEWFLSQGEAPVRGFTRAVFSGVTTTVLAELCGDLLERHRGMSGTWHVAAAPIAKHDLLLLLRAAFERATPVLPEPWPECDRRLDGGHFRAATGWMAPEWPKMVADLAAEEVPR
ncbi:NAD(P)-dependent oxidoreductase [Allostella sp. ATCC 35155]|nr:NAD(P)-dependent oxidoreductase [Stella sp. ATCC 35155]